MTWMWLSFADAELPEGEQFLGVAIVDDGGWDILGAGLNAHALGINPGGEIMGYPVPDEHLPDETLRNRLLSMEELRDANLA